MSDFNPTSEYSPEQQKAALNLKGKSGKSLIKVVLLCRMSGLQLNATINIQTCIVDEDVQSGLHLQEVFSKAANRLQTPQVQLHKHHLIAPTLLPEISNTIAAQ